MTIPSIIKEALKDGNWHFAGRVEEFVRSIDGAKFMTTGRRLREMREEGEIEVKYEQVGAKGPRVAMYRLIREPAVIRVPLIRKPSQQLSLSF